MSAARVTHCGDGTRRYDVITWDEAPRQRLRDSLAPTDPGSCKRAEKGSGVGFNGETDQKTPARVARQMTDGGQVGQVHRS